MGKQSSLRNQSFDLRGFARWQFSINGVPSVFPTDRDLKQVLSTLQGKKSIELFKQKNNELCIPQPAEIISSLEPEYKPLAKICLALPFDFQILVRARLICMYYQAIFAPLELHGSRYGYNLALATTNAWPNFVSQGILPAPYKESLGETNAWVESFSKFSALTEAIKTYKFFLETCTDRSQSDNEFWQNCYKPYTELETRKLMQSFRSGSSNKEATTQCPECGRLFKIKPSKGVSKIVHCGREKCKASAKKKRLATYRECAICQEVRKLVDGKNCKQCLERYA
jgi:hypothetical protein